MPITKPVAHVSEVVVIAPIPKYITQKCYGKSQHIESYGSEDFEREVTADVDMLKQVGGMGAGKRLMVYRFLMQLSWWIWLNPC
jgi:hypothetical protein